MNHLADHLWHEASPGVFQRSMTPLECFFNPLEGWSVWISIKLGPVSNTTDNEDEFIDRVRRAWIQALYEQPHLASTYNFPESICAFTTVTETSLTSWLRETFIIAENPYTALATQEKPILCINPTTRQVLFRTPHYYIDGIGATLLIADIVSHIADPQSTVFGDEAKNLSPIFEVATGMPAARVTDHERGADMANKFLQSQPSTGLPFQDGPTMQHSVSEIRLSLKDSNYVVLACKARGLTVTHAVHAALIQATAEINPIPGARYYTSFQIYNWRARVKAEYQKFRTALYVGTFPMSVRDPALRNFDDLSKELKQMYSSTNQDMDIAKAQGPWWSGLNTALAAVDEVPPMSTPVLSSLGIIEKALPQDINGIKVDSYRFGMDVKGPAVAVYLWNWGGRLSICASWDRGFHEEGAVDVFLGNVMDKLAQPLGLSFV